MKKSIYLSILLTGLLVLVSACQEEPAGSVNLSVPATRPENIVLGETGYDDPVLHREFEEAWTRNPNVQYWMAEGTINRHTGGELVFAVPTWPAEYEVRLKLDPEDVDSLSYHGPDDIYFRIAIPARNDSGSGYASYEFFPDGIKFIRGIEVTLCIPPWIVSLPDSDSYDLVSIDEDWHELERHFVVTGRQGGTPGALLTGAEPDSGWTRTQLATEISYRLKHFSRWGVTSGTDDQPSSAPGTLQAIQTLAGCWTMVLPVSGPLPVTPILR